jgi:uncharacterized protein YndB with AHSA1/START domain
MPAREPLGFESSLVISASPLRIISAFFDPQALADWWQVARSVTTARTLGAYAVEWDATDFRDDVLGPLGGTFHGTVMEFSAVRGFFIADAYWLPPEGDPIGPMGLEVTCAVDRHGTLVRVAQRGYEEGARWRRYYEVIGSGWSRALESLKAYLEQQSGKNSSS